MSVGDAVDNAIGVFAPVYAARRQAARHAMKMGATYYQGARRNRLTYNWATGQESADTALDADLQTLRDRSRDLNRNNSIAAGITDTVCVNAIKTGMNPQARIDPDAIGITEDQADKFQEQAERVWNKWKTNADARRKLTFNEIQFLALRQILESGEFLSLRRALPTGKGREYMLALDVMEPDRLETPGKARQNPNLRWGVETDDRGEPIAYHIRKSHPGDSFYPKKDGLEYKRVPARDNEGRPLVFHIFPMLRPGQTRGIPFFAPVIEQFKVLADYIEAELVGARVAACFSAFVTMEAPYAGAVGRSDETNDNSQRLESLEPGIVEYLGNGEDITFAKPDRPGTTFDQFVVRILRMIGAALGLPYELVLKDFSKTNYSSSRAALLQAYRMFQIWQQMLIDHLCQPIWELLIEEAWLRGEVEAPGFQRFKWDYTRTLWVPPGWQWVDPKKEADANAIALKHNWKTRADVCAEQGGDWEEKAEQAAREKKKFDELGLEFAPKKEKSDAEPKGD